MQLCQALREVFEQLSTYDNICIWTLILTGLMKHKEHLFKICLQEIIADNL